MEMNKMTELEGIQGVTLTPCYLSTRLRQGEPRIFRPSLRKRKQNYKCDVNTKMNIYLE